MLIVVRHADAGDQRDWDGPEVLRPLSPAGVCQAAGLVVRLEDYPVEQILCSPTLRCHQTVEPLARDRFLRIERVAALGVETSTAALLAMVRDPDLRDAVLCTHDEVISRLLPRLMADGLIVEEPLRWPEGSTWLLQRNGPLRARYLPPLALSRRARLRRADEAGQRLAQASRGSTGPR
jgi:phosphohistidine phosphatase SixA